MFPKLDECCARRALAQAEKVRDFTVTRYAAKSWSRAPRVVPCVEVTRKGADIPRPDRVIVPATDMNDGA